MIRRSEIIYIGSATADNRNPKHTPLLSITTAPSAPFSKNSKYYNSTDKLIYSATQDDTWNGAKTSEPVFGTIYEFSNNNVMKYYIWDGDNMVETDLEKYELLANKVNNIEANKTSTVKYPTVKSVYDFVKNQGIARNFDEVGITKTTHNDTILELAREIQSKKLTTGTILFGEIRNSDMPFNGNAEVRIEVLETKGAPNYYQVIEFTLYSTNVAPNEWKYLYYGAEHQNPNDDVNPITWIPSLKPTNNYNTDSVNTYPSSKALSDGLATKQNKLNSSNVITTGEGNVVDGVSANDGTVTITKNTTLTTVATSGSYNDLDDKPSVNSVTLSGNKTSNQLELENMSVVVQNSGTELPVDTTGYSLGNKFLNTTDKKIYEVVEGPVWNNGTTLVDKTQYIDISNNILYYYCNNTLFNNIQSFNKITGQPTDNANLSLALSAKQDVSNISQDYNETSTTKYPSSKALSDAQKVNVKSVNNELPDTNGNVVVSNVASADQLNSPDSINDYGKFVFRTSAGTKSISSDSNTYLSQATLMSIQGEILNPRRSPNNIDKQYNAAQRVFASIDATTFGVAVNHVSGEAYTFNFDGTDWTLQGETPTTINLEDYGISLTGTSINGDSCVVNYTYDDSGEEPVEYANITYNEATRIGVLVDETTFASKVNNVVGSYNFVYSGDRWFINDISFTTSDLNTQYGITIIEAGTESDPVVASPVSGDSLTVTYNGDMKVATPTSFVTSSFNQFNPANVLNGCKIENGNIVPATGYSVAFIKGVGGLNNAYGSRFGDYTIYDDNTTGTIDTVAFRKEAPTVGYTKVGTLTENPTGVFSGFTQNDRLDISFATSRIPNNITKFEFGTKISNWNTSSGVNEVIYRSHDTSFIVRVVNNKVQCLYISAVILESDDLGSDTSQLYIKVVIKDRNQEMFLSSNGTTWTSVATNNIEFSNFVNFFNASIGCNPGYNTQNFQGNIYLLNTYSKINGVTWFNGQSADTPQPVITSGNEGVVVVNKSTLQDPPQDMLEPNKIQYITFPVDGYICVSMTNTSKLCVHPEWSGYMDKVYQDYIAPVTWENNPLVTDPNITGSTPKRRKPSIINIPTQGIDTDKLTQNPIAFEPISCKDYLARVGLVYDEIRFEDHRYIKRIEREQYSAERVAELEGEGKQLVYDSHFIYWVLPQPKIYVINCTIENNAPVLDTNQSGQYMVCDFGTEEFTGTEVAVLGNFLYGNNLVDKLRTDVLTKSAQSLSQEQKEQVWKNLGTLPLYNYSKTIQSNALLVITLEEVYTLYDLTPETNITSITIDDSQLLEKENAWYTFYLHISIDPTTVYNIDWDSNPNITWGNTSPTMTAGCHYLFSFTKPKGSSVWVGNQCYTWQE